MTTGFAGDDSCRSGLAFLCEESGICAANDGRSLHLLVIFSRLVVTFFVYSRTLPQSATQTAPSKMEPWARGHSALTSICLSA